MSAGIATIGRPGAAGCCHSQKWPRATAAPCWQSHLGPRARWGAPPVVVEGASVLLSRPRACLVGAEKMGRLADISNQRSQRWEMVSQLLSAAAEAELRHLRDERRGQSPSSPLRASAPAILRTSASGKASCSSGSAPICCCVSNTWDLQPSQQRARKQASFAVFSVQQPASTCPYRAATSKRRPPAKQLRGFMQQRRWSWVASG